MIFLIPSPLLSYSHQEILPKPKSEGIVLASAGEIQRRDKEVASKTVDRQIDLGQLEAFGRHLPSRKKKEEEIEDEGKDMRT